MTKDWTETDSASLRNFIFQTESGRKLIPELKNSVPKIKSTTMEAAALTGNRHAGAMELLEELDKLISFKQPKGDTSQFIDTSPLDTES